MDRISTFLPTDNMQFHLRNRERAMNEMTNKLATQSRIKQLRDDPLAAGRATRFQSGIRRMQTFQDNIDMARGRLAFAEGAVRQVLDILHRMNEIAVQGANGIYDRNQMGYMAEEVDQMLSELLILANGRSEEGNFLFSGFEHSSEAFRVNLGPVAGASGQRVTSVDYIGDIGQNYVEVVEGATVPLNLPGNHTFWVEDQQIYSTIPAADYRAQEDSLIRIDGVEISVTAGDNVFAIISKINSSAPGVRARMDPVANSLVLETTTPHQIWPEDVGSGTVLQDLGILAAGDNVPPQNLAESARVFGGSIFDMAEAISDLKMLEFAHRTTLATTARILKPTLLDFLR
jgi:flagellar hook-associated protein 3 FlgL